jgi:hypothetical protein
VDVLFVATSLEKIYQTLSPLLWNFWQGSGSFVMPTTGVAYIKASPLRTPFTVSIICDNFVNAWTLEVQGVECALKQLSPGWTNLHKTVGRLREHALVKLKANSTGGVLQHPTEKHWDKVIQRIAVEETMQGTSVY